MTRLRLFRLLGIGFALSLLAAGCGDDEEQTPTELCQDVARTECHRIFYCTTEAERTAKGLPAGINELTCVAVLAGPMQLACETATADRICAGTQTYTASDAQTCIRQANAASCDAIKANFPSVMQYAPMCNQCVPKF
jgi:hypothetical protein